MERFGIFELLDALSALPREGADQRAEAGQKTPAEEDRLWRAAPPSGGGGRRGGTEKAPLPGGGGAPPPPGRSVFPPAGEGTSPNAPGGRTAHDPAPNAPDGRTAHDPAPKALESFLKRHDALSKKAEKK